MRKQQARSKKKMFIVGQVSTPEEAIEIEFIAKSLVVAYRIKALVQTQVPN
jgi:hypothetical protein